MSFAIKDIALLLEQQWFVCGIEKEGLRTTAAGHLSQVQHPQALGAKLTHPYITTDFGEAQLELITTPSHSTEDALRQLAELHSYIYHSIGDELFWPASMPCVLPEDKYISIADFGCSFIGRAKELYRIGLSHRYGSAMQTVSGVHFNFSLSNDFWHKLAKLKQTHHDQAFVNSSYFDLVRNYRRYSFVINWLFGGSPGFDQSFMNNSWQAKQQDYTFVGNDTWISDATSLRMSDIGYMAAPQKNIRLCFNCLEDYTTSIREALAIPIARFSEIGVCDQQGNYLQLNDKLLQIENEYYSHIRPKRTTNPWLRPVVALEQQGIEYIEIRNIDLDPYAPYGIDIHRADFMVLFLLWCLLETSPAIPEQECDEIQRVLQQATVHGLSPQSYGSWRASVHTILDRLESTALLLERIGQVQYAQALKLVRKMHLPSQKLRDESQKNGYITHLVDLAKAHKKYTPQAANELIEQFQLLADKSFRDQSQQEQLDQQSGQTFDQFLQDYLRL